MREMMQQEIQTALRNVLPPIPPASQVAPPAPIPSLVILVAPVAPVAPQRLVINEGGVTMFDFMKLKLPVFIGKLGEDPNGFLEKVDRKIRHLPCSEARTIELMSLKFEDRAANWYEREIDGWVHTEEHPTWRQFKEKLLKEYLTAGLREKHLVMFEQLKQDGKSVPEYAKEFQRLSTFARKIGPTEEDLIERFRRGLNTYLHNAQMTREYSSLAVMIDKDTRMEAKY